MDYVGTDTTRMSTKGQVVIPEDIRDTLGLEAGTQFVVLAHGDTVLLKKIGRPSKEDIRRLFAESHRHAKKMGFTKTDLTRIIRETRAKR
jgi:AbrB family looped-hinge helix DNA binding protein